MFSPYSMEVIIYHDYCVWFSDRVTKQWAVEETTSHDSALAFCRHDLFLAFLYVGRRRRLQFSGRAYVRKQTYWLLV